MGSVLFSDFFLTKEHFPLRNELLIYGSEQRVKWDSWGFSRESPTSGLHFRIYVITEPRYAYLGGALSIFSTQYFLQLLNLINSVYVISTRQEDMAQVQIYLS